MFIKTDNELILFNSFGGRKFNDSPRVLFEHIISNPKYHKFKCVWAFEKPEEFNVPNAEKVKIDTLRYFFTALRAKYWISSVNIERGLKFKKKNTIYLNTWHGAGTKKIGNAVSKRNDFDFRNVDYMLVQSEYEMGIFQKDFRVKKESFLAVGYPRSDELFHVSDSTIKEIKLNLELPEDKNVILYAPTWRESQNKGLSYDIAPPLNIETWEKKLSDKYIILFRTHAFTTKVLNLEFNNFVYDFSKYENVNHLLMISDILITDYSTIVFDYSILERPFFCFGYDYQSYKEERGFYIDLNEEYPNGVQSSEDEVINLISNIDYMAQSKETKEFKDKYIEVGGQATKLVLKTLFKEFDD